MHEFGLSQAGDAFHEDMAFSQEAGQDTLDDLFVTDDDLTDLFSDALEMLLKNLGLLFDVSCHCSAFC
jgi:hypothetical protein